MQGDGPFTDGINVTIRRNYIYEDAYDKLSPENGTETHIKPVNYCSLYPSDNSTIGSIITYMYLLILLYLSEFYWASG